MLKGKLVFKNIFYSFVTRLLILILGIIIPRLLITSFGSEVNGLLSTVTQIFTYLALVEAGIGNSAINALFKPLDEEDYDQANEVLSEAKTYYRKASVVYGVCIIVFSIIYTLVAKTTISKGLLFGIIILQGGANFIGYWFTAIYTHLLTADGKKYINENISFISYVATSIIKIILILLGANVLAVQVGHFVVNILKVPIIVWICKKKYPWINLKTRGYKNNLKERGAFIIHEISNTIFNNTDVFIISTFCSFAMASVYTVYNLVYSSLNTLLITASSGLGFVLGQNQHKDKDTFLKIYDVYSIVYSCVTYIIFTVSVIMIVPFVKLYTDGVTDIDYFIKGLPLLFTLINLLSGVRATSALLITVSGNAEATKNRSIIEAVINLVSSIVLVNILGIKGVLYGTIIALLYRSNDIIIYANKRLLHRNPLKEYKNVIINTVVFFIIYFATDTYPLSIDNYGSFIIYGIVITFVITLVYVTIALVSNFKLLCDVFRSLKEKLHRS